MFAPNSEILIVDDFLTMRKELRLCLEQLGYKNITEAENGRKAWEFLADPKSVISLVLSDWNMPESTGLDLLKRVRAESRTKHIPFILITTESEKSTILEAVKAGVSNYVVKPFDVTIIKDKLEAVFKKVQGG